MDPHVYSHDFEIYLVTNPKSRKVTHLLNNNIISLNFFIKISLCISGFLFKKLLRSFILFSSELKPLQQ